ncbi:uncharacterized protein NEMAJ01_0005 [Nematocida major]|uniref:uncharacterized protein n=1 Tax=Nematocida major TaxID=1912982 RepID=UPI002008BA57|nr:uncharacterized protein NEMAJ01_0005 [Nematocida major]KAH9385109.1 hypothetical protein NEMAJ01_0005 [Nematocida major]
MAVEEVKNEQFRSEQVEKKRKRVKTRRTRVDCDAQPAVEIEQKSVSISEFVLNSTNIDHRVYRDILINRRNGERVSSLNPIK